MVVFIDDAFPGIVVPQKGFSDKVPIAGAIQIQTDGGNTSVGTAASSEFAASLRAWRALQYQMTWVRS